MVLKPIILASGYNIDTQPEINFLDEWDGFIQKPFDIKIFSRMIRNVLYKALESV